MTARAPDADEFDVLSAIWILACNDEEPNMSYRGIEFRVRPPESVDVKALVARHSELFRLRMREASLEPWKERIRAGGKMPSWVRAIDPAEREAAMAKLTIDDFFRSQFRAEPDSPRSPIDILKWGLEHIDRLRKARTDAQEGKTKRFTSFWLPIGALAVSITTVVMSAVTQRQSMADQRYLKRYEIGFRPKQDGYVNLISSLSASLDSALVGSDSGSTAMLKRADNAVVQLEPLLGPDEREQVMTRVREYENLVGEISTSRRSPNTDMTALRRRGEAMTLATRQYLYPVLFPKSEE